MSKARWAEFVNEYGNLDEVKNVFALEQQTIENYEIKINKKFTLKSLFTNRSYAVDVDGIKTYYPVKGNRINAKQETETLQRTIKYEENLNDEEISSDKVQLYEVDLELLPSISGIKRKYVINIVSGNLYSIDQVKYEGLIYHTPRYGIKEEEVSEDVPEEMVTIQYSSGIDSTTYTQNVPISQSSAVTLDALSIMNITNPGYKFVHWKDVTDGDTQNGGTSEEIVEKNTSTFEKKIGGYFEVVNELKEILGEDWEEDIIDIIEQNKEDMEQTENESLAETARQQTINSILFYLIDSSEIENGINDLISNPSKANITNGSIVELAEWFILETDGEKNVDYIKELQQYESEEVAEGGSEDSTGIPSTTQTQGVWYIDQATNVDMQGRKEMKLEAEWEVATVTLDGNGGTVNGWAVDVIGVKEGEQYGTDLLYAVMEKTGYGFEGWYTDSVNGTKVEDTDIYYENNLNNNTLYAHWQNSNIVTVTYDAGNGGVLKDTKTRTKTVTKTTSDKLGKLPTAVVEGVEFTKEWYDAETGGNRVNKNTPVTSNMTIYCQWSKVELHTNGGTLTRRADDQKNKKYYYTGASYIEKFNKWNPLRNGAIYVGDGYKINKQQDINYGQLPVSKEEGWNRYIEKQETTIATREGETKKLVSKFLGWYTTQDKKINNDSIWKNEYGTDLYAKWKEKYAIIYDANGGSWKNKNGEKRQQIRAKYQNSKYPTIGAKPTKEECTFVGWFDDPIGGTEIKLGNSNYLVDKNITLYAHWEPVVFEVAIDQDTITDTGWTQKVTETSGSLSGYNVMYYISKNSQFDKNASMQTNANATGKEDFTTYYVWAKATKDSVTIQSTNYIKVKTLHLPKYYYVVGESSTPVTKWEATKYHRWYCLVCGNLTYYLGKNGSSDAANIKVKVICSDCGGIIEEQTGSGNSALICDKHYAGWTNANFDKTINGYRYYYSSCINTIEPKNWGGHYYDKPTGNLVSTVTHNNVSSQLCPAVQRNAPEKFYF